jgi:hypothetical protein
MGPVKALPPKLNKLYLLGKLGKLAKLSNHAGLCVSLQEKHTAQDSKTRKNLNNTGGAILNLEPANKSWCFFEIPSELPKVLLRLLNSVLSSPLSFFLIRLDSCNIPECHTALSVYVVRPYGTI